MFAVVDIETTGGNPLHHEITEVAIVIHDGHKVLSQYSSLINPQVSIPPFITSLTGIDDELVRDAPTFDKVIDDIANLLEGHIFVAHNVNFDYGFLKKKFEDHNRLFKYKKLCTVRLSRKLYPRLRSYSLGNICSALGIINDARHRALGDAKATVELLDKLIEVDDEKLSTIMTMVNKRKEFLLPPNVVQQTFEALPPSVGVYFFHDLRGNIIYIGKAKNIKKRVKDHFSGNTHSKKKTLFRSKIHDITYQETGSEFTALLLENELIKKHYPYYNRANKKFSLNYGVYKYTDQKGYIRLGIGRVGKRNNPLLTFPTQNEAMHFLLTKCLKEGLCMQLSGITKNKKCNYISSTNQTCTVCNSDISVSAYNQKVTDSLAGNDDKSYVIRSKGRNPNEYSVAVVEKGRFLGVGYFSEDVPTIDELKGSLQNCYDTKDSQMIIHTYIKKARIVSEEPFLLYEL